MQRKLFGAPIARPKYSGYHTILADPPWLERGAGKIKRGADRHYPLMSTKDIVETMGDALSQCVDKDQCHLWLWVTNNFLPDGLKLVDALGFRYITNVAWIKLRNVAVKKTETGSDMGIDAPVVSVAREAVRIGLGQYLRGSHELLLFATRGQTKKPNKAPPSVIIAPREQHSSKPDEQYRVIETISPPPRLEMFARAAWPGWDSWGNEASNGKR
jgi:N6-adenosine-specific RNA methylase IME4